LAKTGGVEEQVAFVGGKSSEELAVMLPKHKIMVVPSRWLEPFGIVAVEGVASGCVVVGTTGGGLPEAIGPCGPLYANGDVVGLTSQLERLLSDDKLMDHYRMQSETHLRRFRLPEVARNYLKIFENLLNGQNGETPSIPVSNEPKRGTI
jgi:glycosyltransferase involved in cell wall biosynthesis